MQRTVHEYLRALEAGDADRAATLFIPDGWVESPFLGRLPVRQYIRKVAEASRGTKLTVHDVLVSAEGHLRAVAYYQYDWRLKDGSRVSFDCADVFNFDPSTGHIQSIVLVYDTHPVRAVVENTGMESADAPRRIAWASGCGVRASRAEARPACREHSRERAHRHGREMRS